MKIKYLIYAIAIFAMITSCEERHIDDKLPSQVAYIVNPGFVKTPEFYNIEQYYEYSVYAHCAGIGAAKSNCVLTYSPDLLDSYNATNGVELKLLPQNCYKVINTEAVMDKNQSAKFAIRFDNHQMSSYFNNDFSSISNYVIPFELSNDGVVPLATDLKIVLVSPQLKAAYVYVSNGGLTRVTRSEMNAEESQEYSMTVKTVFENQWDIALSLESDVAALSAFNKAYKTQFANIAPADAFKIIGDAVIPAGKNEATFKVSIDKSKLPADGIYIVPLVLTGTDRVDIDQTRNGIAIYIYQTANFGMLSKVNYADYTISANAYSWQNAKDYAPIFAFDGIVSKTTPFGWYGRWNTSDATGSGPVGSYPNWWLSADFGQEITICGASRWPRQNGSENDVRGYTYEMSLDGENWFYIGENDFGTTPGKGEQFTSFDSDITLRYLRVRFTKFNRVTVSCDAAEICLYKR